MERYDPKFYSPEKHGVTQSLLSSWKACRFKAMYSLNGYSPKKTSMGLTYGTIIHGVVEEIYKMIMEKKLSKKPSKTLIEKLVLRVEKKFKKENPNLDKDALEYLEESLMIAEATLPYYFRYWWKKDFEQYEWRALEQTFAIPYKTKDGRKTIIRGKKDGVYGTEAIRLFETKTKSMVNVGTIIDTLNFEFQVMLYLWAVKKQYKKTPQGVTYNIIRRTSLKKKKTESLVSFSRRIKDDVQNRPSFYFIRIHATITRKKMKEFEAELEQIICDYLDWCEGKSGHYKSTGQCIDKYGRCRWLSVCSKGDLSYFTKRKIVFKELEDY